MIKTIYFISFQLIFYHVHLLVKIKKQYVATITEKEGKYNKYAALPRGRVWALQVLNLLSKSLFETSE